MQNDRDLEQLAILLDSKFKGPFGFRFGWDGVIGLIPWVGDLVTSFASGYIVLRVASLGARPAVLVRMILNILVDNALSAVPLVGWAADFTWKSNLKNIALARAHLHDPDLVTRNSKLLLVWIIFILATISISFALLAGWTAWWVFRELVSFIG